jgi:hypothetical protein
MLDQYACHMSSLACCLTALTCHTQQAGAHTAQVYVSMTLLAFNDMHVGGLRDRVTMQSQIQDEAT